MKNFADGNIENRMVLFDEEEEAEEDRVSFYDEIYKEEALEELRNNE